jgi:hypothetical protein
VIEIVAFDHGTAKTKPHQSKTIHLCSGFAEVPTLQFRSNSPTTQPKQHSKQGWRLLAFAKTSNLPQTKRPLPQRKHDPKQNAPPGKPRVGHHDASTALNSDALEHQRSVGSAKTKRVVQSIFKLCFDWFICCHMSKRIVILILHLRGGTDPFLRKIILFLTFFKVVNWSPALICILSGSHLILFSTLLLIWVIVSFLWLASF